MTSYSPVVKAEFFARVLKMNSLQGHYILPMLIQRMLWVATEVYSGKLPCPCHLFLHAHALKCQLIGDCIYLMGDIPISYSPLKKTIM